MTTGAQLVAFRAVVSLGAMSPGPDSPRSSEVRRTLDGLSGAALLGLGALAARSH